MPRPTRKLPSYRLHKPSGRAVVTIDCRDHYLGAFGTTESRDEYDRAIGLAFFAFSLRQFRQSIAVSK